MSQTALIMRLMASSIAVANKAGAVIRQIMTKGDLGIVDKGINDLQTEADRKAQQLIVSSLARQYPKIKIIGEEGEQDLTAFHNDFFTNETDGDFDFLSKNYSKPCPESLRSLIEDELVIWVDPLDGTKEYTEGFVEHVTVLIGISWKDLPIGGVIHQPYFKNGGDLSDGRTIWGIRDFGCGGGFTPINPPAGEFIVTTTRSHCTELVEKTLKSLNPTNILRVGGAGYKVLQLLEGKAHAYVFASPGCKKWDTCAPEAILQASGGVLTDITGTPYKYGPNVMFSNRGGVLATAATINHSEIVTKIPDSLKQALSK